MPVELKRVDLNTDTGRFVVMINPKLKHFVMPFFVFQWNKEKANIQYQLRGVGEGRDYSIIYKRLAVLNGTDTIGKSRDPGLFTDRVQKVPAKDGISPLYSTKDLLPLVKPKEANLRIYLEFDILNKNGRVMSYTADLPLEKIKQKSFTLFNPFKIP